VVTNLGAVTNNVDQPVGEPLEWQPAARPLRLEHRGRHVVLRPLDPAADADALYALSHEPTGDPSIWTYLYDQPFATVDAYRDYLQERATSADPLVFVITDAHDGRQLGQLTYMSIEPDHGSIELGSIWFSPELQRTPAATETIFLLTAHAFDDLGYRRLEWKCNALNEASRNAALRYGFLYEGLFLQHRVVKGRNRDTAWFALTDKRWPAVKAAFETWLAAENFKPDGLQVRSLRELTGAIAAN
jgi:RimJ/RimL family protein N-acetyltransferase